MNIPNRASVHHFMRWAFWASVSFGSWAGETFAAASRTAAEIRIIRAFLIMGSLLGRRARRRRSLARRG
jgi:hypothetical protein